MILAGDLGGTNARLALFSPEQGASRPVWRHDYRAAGADWSELVVEALREAGVEHVHAAALAVAGPVEKGEARLTNLGWHVSASRLAERLGLAGARILNDLEAAARGLLALGGEDLLTLQAGKRESEGNRVLCSPGTGFGVGALVWDGSRHHALASEGGHATLSPLDDEDRALSVFLARRHGHVSWERVLSGPGLVALYEFERERAGSPRSDALGEALSRGDGPSAITESALRGDRLAERTLLRFAHLLGVASGNFALTFLARGGVYLGGGIPPRIRAFLERPAFLEAFLAKGRVGWLLDATPVHIVMNPDCGLLGAALCALEDAASMGRG